MGLKGYRLWVTGKLDSTCRAPPPPAWRRRRTSRAPAGTPPGLPRSSGTRCSIFLSKGLEKPVFSLDTFSRIGSPGALSRYGSTEFRACVLFYSHFLPLVQPPPLRA
jgi:hypothetical protein